MDRGTPLYKIGIPGTDLCVSRFIFGTASLFSVGVKSMRHKLLAAAHDHGFTHFDTAPYYGFGWAERDLASLLAAHRDVTVTTKVGLYSPGGERQSQILVVGRKVGGRFLPSLSKPMVDWNVARARCSLEGSLKRLGRSHIDLYFLHEPSFEFVNTEEWLRWLEDEVKAGRVRRFGISLHAQRLHSFIAADSPLARIVQTTDSLDRRDADVLIEAGRTLQITYGYVSAARAQGWTDVPAVLAAALERNRDGAIIVSSRKIQRLPQYAKIIERNICDRL